MHFEPLISCFGTGVVKECYTHKGKGKVKQSHYRPGVAQRVLRNLRFPDFMKTAQDGGKVVSLRHRPPLPPGNIPCSLFC